MLYGKKKFFQFFFSLFLRGLKVCVLWSKVKVLFGSPHYEGLISKNCPPVLCDQFFIQRWHGLSDPKNHHNLVIIIIIIITTANRLLFLPLFPLDRRPKRLKNQVKCRQMFFVDRPHYFRCSIKKSVCTRPCFCNCIYVQRSNLSAEI